MLCTLKPETLTPAGRVPPDALLFVQAPTKSKQKMAFPAGHFFRGHSELLSSSDACDGGGAAWRRKPGPLAKFAENRGELPRSVLRPREVDFITASSSASSAAGTSVIKPGTTPYTGTLNEPPLPSNPCERSKPGPFAFCANKGQALKFPACADKGQPNPATVMPPAGEADFCLLFGGFQKAGRLPGRFPAVLLCR